MLAFTHPAIKKYRYGAQIPRPISEPKRRPRPDHAFITNKSAHSAIYCNWSSLACSKALKYLPQVKFCTLQDSKGSSHSRSKDRAPAKSKSRKMPSSGTILQILQCRGIEMKFLGGPRLELEQKPQASLVHQQKQNFNPLRKPRYKQHMQRA